MFTPRASCTDVPGAVLAPAADGVRIAPGLGKQTERWETRPAREHSCTRVTARHREHTLHTHDQAHHREHIAAHAWPWPHQRARLLDPPGVFRDAVEQLGASRSVRRESLLLSVPATSYSPTGIFTSQSLHFIKTSRSWIVSGSGQYCSPFTVTLI